MKFSALASLYSGESPEYLDQALESLHKQTLQADEVVIVHDGPLTDGLYSCLEKWKCRLPIKEVKLQKNRGIGPAKNAGIKECSHESIAIFDTDDINHPKRFERQIQHLKQNPRISVLGTWMKIFKKDINDISSMKNYPIASKKLKDSFLHSMPLSHPSVMFSRKADILSVGGYPNVYGMEDYLLFLTMIKRGYLFENIPEYLLYYRVSNDYFFFDKKLKVFRRKRWGFRSCQPMLTMRKKQRELGMDFEYREFFLFLRALVGSLFPFSFGISFSKEEPKEYKSLLNAIIYFPFKFLFGVNFDIKCSSKNPLFNLIQRSYIGRMLAIYPSLETAIIKVFNVFIYLGRYLGFNLKLKNPYPTVPYLSRSEKNAIKSYKNKHKGRRCFILGNGPSLNKADLGKLKNEITFGTNGIFLMTKRNGFKPTYYVSANLYATKHYLEDILKYKCKKFIATQHRHLFHQNTDISFIPIDFLSLNRYGMLFLFSFDCSKTIPLRTTITYVCMQLAFYMGFSDIYLIGMDFHYEMSKYSKDDNPHTVTLTGNNDPNHFDPHYHIAGQKIAIPNLKPTIKFYKLAKKNADKTGRSIYNATVGGKLEVFERVDYNSLF